MRKLLTIVIITIISILHSYGQDISRNNFDSRILAHIPESWIIRDSTSGDLNKDGLKDIALMIQNNDKQYYLTDNEGFGSDSINSNPRVLLIYFQHADGYQLIKSVEKIIPDHVNPTNEDPYGGIRIEKGLLMTGYHFWANFGSWLMYETTYKFRFQHNDFYLIGIEHDSTHRGNMENEKISVNFSTRKVNIKKTFPSEREEETNSEWKTFTLKELYPISEVWHNNIVVLDMYF